MAPPALPTGLNAIAAIRPALQGILIGHSFTVVILVLLLALFYFSTPSGRQKPIFILNVVTLSLAIVVGVLLDYRGITIILSPHHTLPLSLNLAIGVLGFVQYILVDTILLLRLSSVYPLSFIGATKWCAIMAFPLSMKLLRFVNLVIFIVVLVHAERSPDSAEKIGIIWAQKPYLKIEWASQAVDNAYASGLFLISLWRRHRAHIEHGSSSSGLLFAHRIRVLFWLAVSTFMFPLFFSIAQLVIVFQPPTAIAVSTINDVVLVNTSVAVIGVVFATLWVESSIWLESKPNSEKGSESSVREPSVMIFGARQDVSSGAMRSNAVDANARPGQTINVAFPISKE